MERITMKITVIHGSPRKGNTFGAYEMVKAEMLRLGPVEFKEYFLPHDMPEFCLGCYTCFFKGADKCPHAAYVQPILTDLLTSDGFIFTSPIYVLSESAAMKTLLDHLAYIFIPHRPQKEMFRKKALILSTTAGAGTKAAMKTIATSLKFWGVNKIYRCGVAMHALSWDDMNRKRKARMHNKLTNTAHRFYSDTAAHRKHPVTPIQRIMFYAMAKANKGTQEKSPTLDSAYWQNNGWLNGKTPF